MNALAKKTVVLVTHQVEFLNTVDKILVNQFEGIVVTTLLLFRLKLVVSVLRLWKEDKLLNLESTRNL